MIKDKKDKFETIKSMYAVDETNCRFLSTSAYRNMLDNIHKGCYVEAESTGQAGTVVSIIKNKDRIPVCVKVSYKEENGKTYYDHISVDRISFYEPYSFSVPDYEYSDNYEEI